MDIFCACLALYPYLYLAWVSLLQVRAIISDFAVFITIVTMLGVDYALGVPTPKLQVPNVFKVSHRVMQQCAFCIY